MYCGGEWRWRRENILRKMYGGGGRVERSRGGHLGAMATILATIFVSSLRLNQTKDQKPVIKMVTLVEQATEWLSLRSKENVRWQKIRPLYLQGDVKTSHVYRENRDEPL